MPCRTVCGNNKLDPNEECEAYHNNADGNAATYDDYCSDSCQCMPGYEINPLFDRTTSTSGSPGTACTPVCGNDIVDEGEECEVS
jgi:hypothetical protein